MTTFCIQGNAISDCGLLKNSSKQVCSMLRDVVKSEPIVGKTFSGSLKDEWKVSSCNVSNDKTVFGSGNKVNVAEFEESSLLTYLNVKIKREDKSEITHELVRNIYGNAVCDSQKAAPIVKFESKSGMVEQENNSEDFKNGLDSDAFSIPADSTEILPESYSKACIQSNLKLLDFSVVVEDLFPNYLRKLGKAHSNTRTCSCIYCRGEYRYNNDSQHLSQNLQNKKRLMQSQNISNKLRNGPNNQQDSNLKAHQEVWKRRSVFQCDKCSQICKDRAALYNHLPVHGKRYKCPFCSEQFALLASLHAHWKEHNIDKPFRCKQCPAKFWYESILEIHLRVHSKEKPFECKQCSAKFTQEGTLKIHMIVRKAKRPFKCAQCPADFKFKSNLTVHLRVHSGEKPFECNHCPLKFMTSTNLKNHVRVHTGEKPFKCKFCPLKFTQSSTVKTHIQSIHYDERPFKCKLCPLKFKLRAILRNHIRCHSDDKPFKCNECPAKFKQKTVLNNHLSVHRSEGPLKCALCPSKFKQSSALSKHFTLHSDEKLF